MTHEFFGLGDVVATAREAEDWAVARVRSAIGG